jgi:hypothetical protein
VEFAFDFAILFLFYKISIIKEARNMGYLEPMCRTATQFMSKDHMDLE